MDLTGWTPWIVVTTVLATGAEIAAIGLSNWTYFRNPVSKDVDLAAGQLQLTTGRALQMVGFTGAVFTFLLTQVSSHHSLANPLFLLGVGLAYFFVASRLEVAGLRYRGLIFIQGHVLNFGVVLFSFALAVSFSVMLPGSEYVIPFLVVPLAIFAWEVAECFDDVSYLRTKKAGSQPESGTSSPSGAPETEPPG